MTVQSTEDVKTTCPALGKEKERLLFPKIPSPHPGPLVGESGLCGMGCLQVPHYSGAGQGLPQ